MRTCLICFKRLKSSARKYCSNTCEATDKYNNYIKKWKLSVASGSRGIITRNISKHVRRYLLEKYQEKCFLCGWNKINPSTQKVPLEVDHIDGNSENNKENNLRLICPNCHSLSPNFRNLNKGKGRVWRKEKYLKVSTNV